MNIGLIYCAYNCINEAQQTIKPFIEAKDKGLIKNICTVSLPFFEYFELTNQNDGTTNFLNNLYLNNSIDYIFSNPPNIKEHQARDLCLQYLKVIDCDFIWMVDGDEFYQINDIQNIINFIKNNPNNYWYSINFKNYIFDGKQWIDGFCPPRIFKVKSDSLNIDQFYWDNDILYKESDKNISYKNLSNLEIPREIAHIKHMTWLHSNGKLKYEYQMKHFGDCGYKWNYQLDKLEINQQFYLKTNQKIPKINYE